MLEGIKLTASAVMEIMHGKSWASTWRGKLRKGKVHPNHISASTIMMGLIYASKNNTSMLQLALDTYVPEEEESANSEQ
jgi:hypothetical protein